MERLVFSCSRDETQMAGAHACSQEAIIDYS